MPPSSTAAASIPHPAAPFSKRTAAEPAAPSPATSFKLEGGRIVRLAPASALKSDRDVTVIVATSRFLLAGLTDAHVQFSAAEADVRATRPLAAFALRVAAFIEETLDQGFTTVRDAGGLDPAWAQVVAKGF